MGTTMMTPATAAYPAQAAATPILDGGETVEQALGRAQAAAQAKRFNEASGICQDILSKAPNHPPALALQGLVAGMAGDPERGVALLERAVTLAPANASWHAHLSSLARSLNRMDAALHSGNESVRLDPNNADHLVNLSLVLTDLDRQDDATACLIRAIGLRHDHADGHLALAQILLARGDFEPGWLEYEWRNQTEAGKNTMPAMTSAPWNGMRIPAGRLLLVGDQGYGDTIQFARYIPLIADRVKEVVLGCSEEMGSLLRGIEGVTQVHHRWNDVPGHAVNCRLSSLPYLLGTRLDTIPNKVPYLKAAPDRIAHWRQKLSTLPADRPRIGLAWTGRPTHPNDRRRSIPLAHLLPLTEAGPASFISLQKPLPERDREMMGRFPGMTDLSDALTDFGETAALLENLDLVVTVDTSMGHLAGALAKPAWIMLPRAADWRWMLDREDTPWYPTLRLFRQPAPGAWDPVVTQVTDALAAHLKAKKPTRKR